MKICESQSIATDIVNFIVNASKEQAKNNELFAKYFAKYCSSETLKFSYEIHKDNDRSYGTKQNIVMEMEPKPLITDNMFPYAAGLDLDEEKEKLKESLKKTQVNLTRNISNKNSARSLQNKSIVEPNSLQMLKNIEPEQEEDNEAKMKRNGLLPSSRITNSSNKASDLKKNFDRKHQIGYNYNGETMKLKLEAKKNLVSIGLNAKASSEIQIPKTIKKTVEPTLIKYDRKEVKANKFLDEGLETEIMKGLLKPNSRKEKKVSLNSPISQEELSREQPENLIQKNNNQNSQQSVKGAKKLEKLLNSQPENVEEETKILETVQSNKVRSVSESKFSNYPSHDKSSVIIYDNSLLEDLVEIKSELKNGPSQSLAVEETERSKSKLEKNDIYNLEYMKKGNTSGTEKASIGNERANTGNMRDLKLPKIDNIKSEVPKIRERLKNELEVVREVRKKFEEKLRT